MYKSGKFNNLITIKKSFKKKSLVLVFSFSAHTNMVESVQPKNQAPSYLSRNLNVYAHAPIKKFHQGAIAKTEGSFYVYRPVVPGSGPTHVYHVHGGYRFLPTTETIAAMDTVLTASNERFFNPHQGAKVGKLHAAAEAKD